MAETYDIAIMLEDSWYSGFTEQGSNAMEAFEAGVTCNVVPRNVPFRVVANNLRNGLQISFDAFMAR